MKNNACFYLIVLLAAIVPNYSSAQTASVKKTILNLGVSQIIITPQVPILMSGYEDRKTPFTGVHDDLNATALFFDDGNRKALLITADLSGFSDDFIDDISNKISAKVNVPIDNILISATHTHGGPQGTYGNPKSPEIKNYVRVLKEKLIFIALEASKNMVPCRVGMAKTSSKMNISRRALYSDGTIYLGKNPDGACDHELDVIKFEDMQANTLAVLVNWAAHGTTGGQENYEITGDWPGGLTRTIKDQLGKDVVVSVTIGASADIDPIYAYSKDFREIDAVGFHVGSQVLNALDRIKCYPVSSGIQVKTEVLSFAGRKQSDDLLPPVKFEEAADVTIRLSVFKIGSIIFAGISGELMTEIGLEIKQGSPYNSTLILTHCNGSSGYICTDKAFTEGGYEVQVTHLMPGAEKTLIEKFSEMIHSF